MGNCSYKFKLNNVSYSFDTKQELEDFILSNYEEVAKQLPLLSTKFSISGSTQQQTTALNALEAIRAQVDTTGFGLKVGNVNLAGVSRTIGGYWFEGSRLTPEFEIENYVTNSIAQSKQEFLETLRHTDEIEKDADLRKELVNKTDDELKAMYKDAYNKAVEQAEFDLSADMDMWNVKAGSGTVWHFVGEVFFNNVNQGKDTTVDEIRVAIGEFIASSKDKKVKHIVLTDAIANRLLDFLNQRLEDMHKIAGDDLVFMTELPVYNIGDVEIKEKDVTKKYGGLGGIVDLLAINKNGEVFMFDYKTASKSYAKWGAPKKANVSIQQIMYGKMLEKLGLKFSGKYIIPIEYKGFKEFEQDNTTYYAVEDFDGQSPVMISDSDIGERQIRAINKIIKPNATATTPISATVESTLALMNDLFDYVPSTTEKLTDIDKEVETVFSNSKTPGRYKYYNKLAGTTIYIEEADPLKAKDVIKKRIQQAVDSENSIMKSLPNYIKYYFSKYQEAYRTGNELNISFSQDEATNNNVNQMLHQYIIDDSWQIVSNSDSDKIGILIFKNEKTKVINILNITNKKINEPLKLNKGNTLLGKYLNNTKSKAKGLKDSTIADVEMIKAYSFIMSNQDSFDGYNIGSMETWELNFMHRIPNRNYQFVEKVQKDYEVLRSSGFVDKSVMPKWDAQIADLGAVAIDLVANSLSELHSIGGRYKIEKLLEHSNKYDQMSNQAKIDYLNQLHAQIIKMYGTISNVNNDKMRRILNMLAKSIATLSGVQLAVQGDFDNSLFASNSLLFTNPNYLNHPMIEGVRKLVTLGLDNMAVKFQELANGKRQVFKDFYKNDGVGAVAVEASGDPVPHYRAIMERVNGKYTGKLLRPDTPGLNAAQSKFIKELAEMIFNVRVEMLQEQGQSKEAAEGIAGKFYYEMPIMKASVLSAFKSKGFNEAMRAYKDYILNPNRFYDQNQADIAKGEANTFISNSFEYTEPWNEQSRNQVLEGQLDKPIEEDMELVFFSYIMSFSKSSEMNKVAPTINAVRTLIATSKDFQYEDLEKIGKFTDEWVNYVVYNKRKIEKAEEKAAPFMHAMKDLNSMIVLAFSPFQLVTEGLAGFYNNISRTFANMPINKKVGFKSLMKAYGLVQWQNLTQGNMLFVDKVSRYMRIVERSPFESIEKEQVGRNGIVNAKSRWSYFCSEYPNYVNRLSLTMAQMIEEGVVKMDGTEIAKDSPLKLINGKLVYNPFMDPRFSTYLNNKKQDPLTASEEWKTQKALYDARLRDMQGVAGGIVNGELGFPYTARERESMRNFADRLHGHVSPESKAAIEKNMLASMFLQFKSWAFPKVRRWYIAKGLRASEGEYVVVKDENGEITSEFHDLYMEGILQTLGSMAKDIYTYKSLIKAYKELNPTQKENLVLMGSDLAIFAFIMWLISMLTDTDDKTRPALEARLGRAFVQSAGDLNILNTVRMFTEADGSLIPMIGTVENLFVSTINLAAMKEGAGNQFMSNFGIYRSARDIFNVSTK